MKITLINHTQDADTLLLFTKNTRLNMSPGGMEEIRSWTQERKHDEIVKMAKTIKSSWEMCDVVFLVEGISRACAQQMTRTRAACYAMQSQRVNDARDVPVVNPVKDDTLRQFFESAAAISRTAYKHLVDHGVPLEDARGILPMNSECNLVAKYNLRSFTDLVKSRASLRAQGEYNAVASAMRSEVLRAWPWSAPFFESEHSLAIATLESVAKELGIKTGSGPGWEIAKACDLLRKD